ncbi:MAG: SUMF1/EgtB/PvdO family nonheme iron enzyme [Bacteroidota bacterium]
MGQLSFSHMKKLLVLVSIAFLLCSCRNSGSGELIGVQDRDGFYQPIPYGMLFIPAGSYQMGPSDQDVTYALTTQQKTVTVQAFYMDETEITNNEYRQFVYYVRDSIARELLGTVTPEDWWIEEDENGEPLDPHKLKWDTRLRWDDMSQEDLEALAPMIMPEHERYFRRKEIDSRKLNFLFDWIDFRAAARKDFSQEAQATQDQADHDLGSLSNRPQGVKDRSVFLKREIINVYPDTLSWVHDFTYSFNEPLTLSYFTHPAYDNYPVVGVNWKQARAFCVWRSDMLNNYLEGNGDFRVNDFRLPTESEWEWAARGGLDESPYPWGGPYIRNSNGCFLGNYKPLRGNYIDDGGITTVIVAHYAPNDFGLYDMGGNVAEWCGDAYDESAYNFAHDLNMTYMYEAKKTDPEALKRKVIRGGSWKDIGFYMQTSSRSYEYQDTAKCYVGFRCVQTYLGRHIDDGASSSNVYK